MCKYVSIDIETTGTNPDKHQILSFAAIVEDTNNPKPFVDIPKFYRMFIDEIKDVDVIALDINRELIRDLAKFKKDENVGIYKEENFIKVESLKRQFREFLKQNQLHNIPITIAGKNFSEFDLKFLNKIQWNKTPKNGWDLLDDDWWLDKSCYNTLFKYHRRIIDPAILYVDWNRDITLPNLSTCKERAGLPKEVSHNALFDAWDIIQLIRRKNK